jgi:hypothetical protein
MMQGGLEKGVHLDLSSHNETIIVHIHSGLGILDHPVLLVCIDQTSHSLPPQKKN